MMPEDIAVAALALKVGHPVRWIEDRREHLLASVHARDHYYDLTVSAERDGRLLGLEGDVYIDAGAYSLWPTGSFMEASMASRNLTGPYRIRHLNVKTYTVATNKAPMGPYRGVARPGACFAIERLVDEVARELGREPFELRRQNIVTSLSCPTGPRPACGSTPATISRRSTPRATWSISRPSVSARQQANRTAAPSASALRSTPSRAATAPRNGSSASRASCRAMNSATVRMLPDGSVLMHVGIQNHGQGHETTLSQIAAHELTIDPSAISIRYGDTATAPFGFGTFASRSIVFAGGAVASAAN